MNIAKFLEHLFLQTSPVATSVAMEIALSIIFHKNWPMIQRFKKTFSAHEGKCCKIVLNIANFIKKYSEYINLLHCTKNEVFYYRFLQ